MIAHPCSQQCYSQQPQGVNNQCPSTDEQMNNIQHIRTADYYSAKGGNSATYDNMDGPKDIRCSIAKLCPTLRPHGLEHTRLPCPSLSPGVCSDSYPLSQWCYLTISSSAALFSFCLQSFPASGSFQWVSSSHQVAKVLEFQLHHQSFQWIFRVDFL